MTPTPQNDELDRIFSVFSQQSDDKGITLTWSSEDSITQAKREVKEFIIAEQKKLLDRILEKQIEVEDAYGNMTPIVPVEVITAEREKL